MTNKSTKAAAGESNAENGAEVLPAAGSTASGVPTHSFEVSRGPIVSKASGNKEALGIEDVEAPEHKGKPVHIRSRVPTYSAQGRTFNAQDTSVYYPGDFTPEQWAALRSNSNLVISKASVSDE